MPFHPNPFDTSGNRPYTGPYPAPISGPGRPAPTPTPRPTRTPSQISNIGLDPTFRNYLANRPTTGGGGGDGLVIPVPSPDPRRGQVPEVNPDNFWTKRDNDPQSQTYGDLIPAEPNEAGAWFDWDGFFNAKSLVRDFAEGDGDGGRGRTGPTAEELAIERSRVQAINLATYLDGVIESISQDIDARRLSTDQALSEFNRRLDAFTEAGKQFQGLQEFTVPRGSEFIPGFEPGGLAAKLGLQPQESNPVFIDPFAMAADIVHETPVLTDIGAPSADPIEDAVALVRSFI